MSSSTRTPPHDLDAEQGVLASIILEGGGDILAMCREHKVTPAHFFSTAHQIIYEASLELNGSGKSVDDITLPDILNKKGELSKIGGTAYINELTRRIEVTAHAQHWMEILKEKYTRRRIVTLAQQAVESAYAAGTPADKILEDVESGFFALSQAGGEPVEDLGVTIANAKSRFNDAVAGKIRKEDEDGKVSWGHACLDRRWRPMCARKGDYLVGIFADAGTGKSSFVDGIISCALDEGKVVVKHALETSNDNTLFGLAALHSGIPLGVADDARALAQHAEGMKQRRVAHLTEEDRAAGVSFFDKQQRVVENAWERAVRIQNEYFDFLAEAKDKTFFTYDHTQEFTDLVGTTRGAARKAAQHGRKIDLVVVDYLQEVELAQTEKQRMRSDEILDAIAKKLKKLARQLRCPVILIASLSKAVDGGRPTMKHIRGSGGISFILDRAIGLWRPDKTADGGANELSDKHQTVEVWAEQFNKRNVPGWREKMQFHGPLKQFRDISNFTSSSLPEVFTDAVEKALQDGAVDRRLAELQERRGRPKGVKNGEGRAHQRESPKYAAHDDRPWSEGD